MIKPYYLTIVLFGLMYGSVFSLCTLVTLGSLFYRKIKTSVLLPVISGAVPAAVIFIRLLEGHREIYPLMLWGFVLFHTLAVFILLTDKSKDSLFALILAEIFSASLMGSIQTAVFSAANGTEADFVKVTLLYIASYVLSAAFVLLLRLLLRTKDREPLGILQMILLTSMTLLSKTMIGRSFAMSNYTPDVSPEAAIPSVLMLMSVTVLLLLSVRQQQVKRFRELSELSEKYMTSQARHFEQSRDADTEMRMLRHDMKNHITVMNGLYEAGKTDELGRYLRELNCSYDEYRSVNTTGNEIADAIISDKKALAEKNGAELVIDGSLRGLEINAVTLCTILANLLDNSIEALSDVSTKRTITLSAKRSGKFWYICISNPTAHDVNTSAEINTTKPDSLHHGLGLKSVRNAVEKIGGTLELSCKKTSSGYMFTAEVIVPSES